MMIYILRRKGRQPEENKHEKQIKLGKALAKKTKKKAEDIEPKRLRFQLRKIIKGIKKDDQFLLLGLSNQPWAATPEPLVKTYNKFSLISRPNYGTARIFGGKIPDEFPLLATIL
jgi:hypothetical protein